MSAEDSRTSLIDANDGPAEVSENSTLTGLER